MIFSGLIVLMSADGAAPDLRSLTPHAGWKGLAGRRWRRLLGPGPRPTSLPATQGRRALRAGGKRGAVAAPDTKPR